MLKKGPSFTLSYMSMLSRAINMLFYIQDELRLHWVTVIRDWRFNDRMYGATDLDNVDILFYYKIVHVVQNNEKNTRDNQK